MRKSYHLWLALVCIAALALPAPARAQFMSQPQSLSNNPPAIQFAAPTGFALSGGQPFPPIAPATGWNGWPAGSVCPVGSGIANRIVTCVHGTVLWAVEAFLLPFSKILSYTIAACCTLAVALFGVKAALGGVQRLGAEGIILGIKLTAVSVFTWNFGGFFPTVISVMDDMINTTTSYVIYSQTVSCPYSIGPWQRVDCVLDRLIGGILPGSTLGSGVLGFLIGCIFSGPAGFGLFLMGIAFFVLILISMFKSVYIYLNCFIALCFLICVSPLFIPLILFKVTHQYFDKWLRLCIGLILQPIFMFVFMSMLIAALDIVVFSGPFSLFVDIAGVQAQQPGFQVGGYINAEGAYMQRQEAPLSFNLDSRELFKGLGMQQNGNQALDDMGLMGSFVEWQSGLTGQANEMINKNIGAQLSVPTVNMQQLASAYYGVPVSCDASAPVNCNLLTSYIVQIAMAMLSIAVMAYIFYTMLDSIPYLATALSGGMSHPSALGLPNFGAQLDQGLKGAQKAISGGKVSVGRQRDLSDVFGLD